LTIARSWLWGERLDIGRDMQGAELTELMDFQLATKIEDSQQADHKDVCSQQIICYSVAFLARRQDMSVKASVSISEQQDAFVRGLVDQGRYPSASAVVQQGLELLREQTEMKDGARALLKSLLEERLKGDFVTVDEGRLRTEALITEKRRNREL
jgi:antitoxin ParD1/3/4